MRALAAIRRHGPDLFGLALCAVYALPALSYPHGNDQALHWYVGQGLLRGELPYVDAISGKPIGMFLIHALASLLFGDGQSAIRLLEIPTLAACAWLLCRLPGDTGPGQPLPRGHWGAASVLLFGCYYSFFDYWDTAHPELWEAMWVLLAAVIARHTTGALRRPLLCGAVCAVAFMVKYPAAVIALPISMLCGLRAMAAAEKSARARAWALLREAGLYLLGAGAIFALCILPFALTDTLPQMWEVLVTLLTRYAGQAKDAPPGPNWLLLKHGGALPITAGLALAVAVALGARRRARADLLDALLMLLLTAFAFASVVLQQRFFPYHYVVAVPFIAGCVLMGLRAVFGGGATHARTFGPLLAALCLTAIAFYAAPRWCTARNHSYRAHTTAALAYRAGRLPRREFLRPFVGYNFLDHYAVHERIGLAIRKRAEAGDSLCVRGFAPAIYQVSGLRCPSRHVMQPFPAGLPRWELEFFGSVRRDRPRFLVTFEDRSGELRILRQLGYTPTKMPTLYLLLEHQPDPKKRRK